MDFLDSIIVAFYAAISQDRNVYGTLEVKDRPKISLSSEFLFERASMDAQQATSSIFESLSEFDKVF